MAVVDLETANGAGRLKQDGTDLAGVSPTSITDGVSFKNTGKEVVVISKTGVAGSATVVSPATVDGLAVADRTVTVPAPGATGRNVVVGDLDPQTYAFKTDNADPLLDPGRTQITFSGTATEYNVRVYR